MSFLLRESPAEFESPELLRHSPAGDLKHWASVTRSMMTDEKFRVPAAKDGLRRTRLLELLELSIDQYGATLISGRAGSGKTTLAADFIRSREGGRSWYSIGPADSDWNEFSRCFATSILKDHSEQLTISAKAEPDLSQVSHFITECFTKLREGQQDDQRIIVLDNVHHLFDAPWFTLFFTELIIALEDNVRLLILCRSKPNAPLWRMRSKQMLHVIDENLLDFTDSEARVLSLLRGLPEQAGSEARRRAFGRAERLAQYLDELLPASSP